MSGRWGGRSRRPGTFNSLFEILAEIPGNRRRDRRLRFQFSLWDSDLKPSRRVFPLLDAFQFSLWDSLGERAGKPSRGVSHAFNSLFEIRESNLRHPQHHVNNLSILFLRFPALFRPLFPIRRLFDFQFSFWDSYWEWSRSRSPLRRELSILFLRFVECGLWVC